MDIRKIRKLIQIMKETGLAEIEIQSGDESVRLSQQANVIHSNVPQQIQQQQTINPAVISSKQGTNPNTKIEQELSGTPVKSPMVGSVYLAKGPSEKPFVSVGQRVKTGDTLCLIEAMKLFNQIESPVSGVIRARLVENEQPVEFDQILFIIDTDA